MVVLFPFGDLPVTFQIGKTLQMPGIRRWVNFTLLMPQALNMPCWVCN